MKKILFLIFITVFSNSVVSQNSTEMPELRIENKTANKLIVDRKPDYGFVGRDGCVVMDEISMDINELNQKLIRGKIFNSKTKEPLIGAQIYLFITQSDSIQKLVIKTDSNGLYKSQLNGKLNKINVEYIGHRNLKIDFKKE